MIIASSILFSCLIVLATLFSKHISFMMMALVSVIGWWFGLLELSALLFIGVYSGFNYYLITFNSKFKSTTIQHLVKVILYSIWTLLSAALILHLAPGFHNPLIAEGLQLKDSSLITSFYWNLDKVLVAWAASLFVPLWRVVAPANTKITPFLLIPIVLIGFAVIFGLGVLTELVALQIQWHSLMPLLLAANLINTCVAEELIFRGLVQKYLMSRFGSVTGLLLASVVFGLVHFAGGTAYIVLAMLAGLLYGLVYWVTGRLYLAVLTHFLFNALHMLLFTYPMMVR